MRKLMEKFIILAIISLIIGHNAAKENITKTNNEGTVMIKIIQKDSGLSGLISSLLELN